MRPTPWSANHDAEWRRPDVSWPIVTSNAPAYFSDTELGPRPLVPDDLPPAAWTGISATFDGFADQHYFAAEFPEQCTDGKEVSGTSMAGLRALAVPHIPKLGDWPREHQQPETITAMDLVVFGWYQSPPETTRQGLSAERTSRSHRPVPVGASAYLNSADVAGDDDRASRPPKC